MALDATTPAPGRHTPEGGVLIGSDHVRRTVVVYEDPQCPYCRKFNAACGDLLRRETSAGAIAVEYRMRCFLGPESVRADNALALAAEAGRFEDLLQQMFANQPDEGTGGYTHDDLLRLGAEIGLTDAAYTDGVRQGRYEDWAAEVDKDFDLLDPQGTPYLVLDGRPVDSLALYDREALGTILRG